MTELYATYAIYCVKGAVTPPTQIFTIIGFWLLGITNFFLGVCRAPTKGGS